jgi:hypothetical protein
VTEFSTTLAFVRAGMGMTLVPASLNDEPLARLGLNPLRDREARWSVGACRRRRDSNPVLRRFLKLLNRARIRVAFRPSDGNRARSRRIALNAARERVVPSRVTPARVKHLSAIPLRSGRPSISPVDDVDQLTSGTRIKRARIDPASEREAIEASIDAALRDLDSLESVPRVRPNFRRVPPFPGTGRTQALPLLPSERPGSSFSLKKKR